MCRYGIGASSAGPAQTATIGSECTGVSTIPPSAPAMVGLGDYLDIAILQPGTGTSTTVTILPVHWHCIGPQWGSEKHLLSKYFWMGMGNNKIIC